MLKHELLPDTLIIKLISIIGPFSFALPVRVSFGWSYEANTLLLGTIDQQFSIDIDRIGQVLLIAPLIGLGALYWYGRPQPRKLAVLLTAGLPRLVLIISGMEPVLRVYQRNSFIKTDSDHCSTGAMPKSTQALSVPVRKYCGFCEVT